MTLTHENLIAAGFTHAFYEAEWEDVGNAETGPIVAGNPAFHEYLHEADMRKVILAEDGTVEYDGDADPYDFPPDWA